jgi:hypothetical protein
MRVPEGFMRDSCRQHIENHAQQQDITEITLEVAEAGLQQSRQTMETAMKNRDLPADTQSGTDSGKCPFAAPNEQATPAGNNTGDISWSREASERLGKIPAGMSRDMTCKAAEAIAHNQGISHIERSFLEKVLDTFQSGSSNITEALPWESAARLSIQRAPDMVRGMLIREIENWAMRKGLEQVTETAALTVKAEWQQKGYFHLAPDDPRSGNE